MKNDDTVNAIILIPALACFALLYSLSKTLGVSLETTVWLLIKAALFVGFSVYILYSMRQMLNIFILPAVVLGGYGVISGLILEKYLDKNCMTFLSTDPVCRYEGFTGHLMQYSQSSFVMAIFTLIFCGSLYFSWANR